ncbi:MAG: ATP-binding domain-containing protein [Acidimicrobiia bacterium]
MATWRSRIEGWLHQSVPGYLPHGWYAGRPLLITENDHALGLFNGDTGVVVDAGDGLQCAFERRGQVVLVRPGRLAAVETLYAMTIHKSQGSQFGQVVVVLPDEASPILTRELLYTAVTRAERAVTVVGTEAAVRAAVERPVQRASGLRERLWGPA